MENKIFTIKNNISIYAITIYLLIAILGVTEILQIYIFDSRQIYTSVDVPASTIPVLKDFVPELRIQNEIYGFIYWVLTSMQLRYLGFIVSQVFLITNINNKSIFMIGFISTMLFVIVEILRGAYFLIVWFTCDKYYFCIGRAGGTIASFHFLFLLASTLGHAGLGVFILFFDIIMVQSLNPQLTGMAKIIGDNISHLHHHAKKIKTSILSDFGYDIID